MPRRLCRGCNRYSIPVDAPKTCKACSIPCAAAIGREMVAKQRAAQDRARAKQAKAEKQKRSRQKKEFRANDLPHQKELTRRVFNEMICLLDAGQPCISCGKFVCGSRMEAGHFKSVGSHPELRFDPRNVYLQGSGCNSATSGRKRSNLTVSKDYEQRLILRMGINLVEWLNGPHSPAKYTCADLIEMRAVFAAERTRLKKGLGPSRDWRKLDEPEQMRGAA